MKPWLILMTLMLLVGCAVNNDSLHAQTDIRRAAADYCQRVGGETEIRENRFGQGRYCRLPNGRVENEWQFYRSERLDNR
ncbi:putative hemolysin [Vreelandella olivaria]|uniref:putative hemolysin n=1 Tax=Vreelandella olivaria TaxID=390919 RepID=UPI00201EE006|nr:DUF333 domain-containing protein [Halomonas olivaria]